VYCYRRKSDVVGYLFTKLERMALGLTENPTLAAYVRLVVSLCFRVVVCKHVLVLFIRVGEPLSIWWATLLRPSSLLPVYPCFLTCTRSAFTLPGVPQIPTLPSAKLDFHKSVGSSSQPLMRDFCCLAVRGCALPSLLQRWVTPI
jgi:hypothetical protein